MEIPSIILMCQVPDGNLIDLFLFFFLFGHYFHQKSLMKYLSVFLLFYVNFVIVKDTRGMQHPCCDESWFDPNSFTNPNVEQLFQMRSIEQHRSFCITSGVYPKMAIHECLEHEQIKSKSIAKKTSFHKASHQRGKSVR